MPCPNNARLRKRTIAFRVSPTEAAQIEARIAASGMQKQEYLIQSLLHNEISIRFGKYEGEKIAVKISRLQQQIEDIKSESYTKQLVEQFAETLAEQLTEPIAKQLEKCAYFMDELLALLNMSGEPE